jgi:hypothetical protein
MNNPEIAEERLEKKNDPVICGTFSSALDRTRTCDLLIRSDRVSDPIDPCSSPSAPVYGVLLGRRCH